MLDLIQWRARKAPEAPALFFNGRWYSYREMEGRANRLAHRLHDLGVRRGERIAVLARNHPVHFDVLFAAPKLGIVCVPLNPELPASVLAAEARALKPAMLFADSRNHDTAAALGAPWTRLSDYKDWLAVGSPEALPAPELGVDDPLMVLATPRGHAVLPYRQVLLNARHAGDAWELSAQDCTVHCLPCHGAELNLFALPVLYRGGRVVLMSGFDTDEFLGHLALHRVTVAGLTPPMLRRLVQYEDFTDADLSSVRWLASVGSPPIHAVHRALSSRQLPLRLLIAPAEAGPVLFHAPIEDCDARPELLGTPLPDVEPALLDAEGRDVPPGGSGELHVGGPMHFSGYDGAPAVVPGQRVPTGLALRHERDGQFSLLGPLAEAFEANGGWVHPGEVETALLRCAGVQEASVFPVTGADGERRIAAALVMQEGPTRDDAALFAEIEGLLLAPLRPSYLLRQRQLPRDGWGRVDRAALIAALGAH